MSLYGSVIDLCDINNLNSTPNRCAKLYDPMFLGFFLLPMSIQNKEKAKS
jgi:hypothetical protein